ncbi:M3 family oligoendopeptidase [Evansella cellulosilytica]|uniref:Oligoendopeptidase, pepF/M3 family n=1 Tax=Evansella cellulosilytica (strain ATCC 21833 / DSM 2522 / FERM P-1141 / JCM 9156 / N-4) TaxID=649639 RepID=E6TY52_EVAC2|nr:M3 family oligoendopeptidase [Evansella cellulosilytica]ADU32371.1 oligoendopeptidase, pepF/M3 family [Evansella cellulosilytica DSM 2522]
MTAKYKQVWDLDSIFKGGTSDSEALLKFLNELEAELSTFQKETDAADSNVETWANIIVRAQEVGKKVRESGAFVGCLTAQDVKDEGAKLLTGRIKQLSSMYQSILTSIDEQLLAFSDDEWNLFISLDSMYEIVFNLNERRQNAKEKLAGDKEKLIQALSIDGYHAWGDFYSTIVGRMSVDIEEDGEVNSYSVGQAANKMSSNDRTFRKHVFDQTEKAWEKESELFANTLNHLAGFRLKTYEARGWGEVLKEPLQINRMKKETLDVMWDTITKNKADFVKYMERKAKLLGVEKLAMYDVSAPVSENAEEVSYDDAATMIVEQFRTFSPKMADFAQMAFDKEWIEAESRPGKRPGGFCTSFPMSEQSRIFMTYSGSASNVATLAHELGHAYHQHVMNDLPQMSQRYAMNVAETASTFAEMIVADATVKQAETKEAKIQLLDDKLNRGIAFFMNIHARFLFETRFYEERKKGLVSANRLNEIMLEAQKEAYCDGLSEYSPHFWASKLHFHITGVPFYNFPYTFGYLFSMGIYAQAVESGGDFEERYIDLLRDTGRLEVEELAKKHLNVDLTKPDFWQKAIDLVKQDLDTFMELTES